jgi:hypothetical protein
LDGKEARRIAELDQLLDTLDWKSHWAQQDDAISETDTDSDTDSEERDSEFAIFQPEVPIFRPPAIARRVYLSGRRLQAIVKIGAIVLTPERPRYPGGVWHVEGMLNERIVASAIYYFGNENVTESRLSFREKVGEDGVAYKQNDDVGTKAIFGLENENPLIQELGSVITCEGRSIAFPNILQHRVQPFELVDGKREGRRYILVFFLVDPAHRILSTADIPPQCRAWYERVLSTALPDVARALRALIIDYVGSFISHDDALRHREALMKERKFYVENASKEEYERPFSLCEH